MKNYYIISSRFGMKHYHIILSHTFYLVLFYYLFTSFRKKIAPLSTMEKFIVNSPLAQNLFLNSRSRNF